MQVLDRDAVADLRDLYRQRDRLRHAARTPELDVREGEGSRAWQFAVTEQAIVRYEAGMTDAEIAEARR
jgi:hypothetical protein